MAGLLGVALISPGAALAGADYATVDGHQAFSAEANHADYWGKDCDKYDVPDGVNYDSYVISQNYDLIVVKSGSGEFANTIFSNVKGGQTVWADTNGNNEFDPGGQDGDKNISHIIFCGPDETTDTETSTTTTRPLDDDGRDHLDHDGRDHLDHDGRDHLDHDGRDHLDHDGRDHLDHDGRDHLDHDGPDH